MGLTLGEPRRDRRILVCFPKATLTLSIPRHLSPEDHEVRRLHPTRKRALTSCCSGDTTMFPSFSECGPNELTVSALYTMQFDVIRPQERKFSVWVWALSCKSISFLVAQASAGGLFSSYLELVYRDGRTSEAFQRSSHGGRGFRHVFTSECSKGAR